MITLFDLVELLTPLFGALLGFALLSQVNVWVGIAGAIFGFWAGRRWGKSQLAV